MSTFDLQEYCLAMEPIQAGRLLSLLAVADHPHLKREHREKTHRKLRRKSSPVFEESKTVTSREFFSRMLG